jgi:glycosyltransferase involved in cell wall biosynthesis
MLNKEIVLNTPRASYYVGGGEKVPIKQAEELASLGYNVHLVTSKVPEKNISSLYSDLKNDVIKGVTIHEVPMDKHGAPHQKDPEEDPNIWNSESLAFSSATADLIKKINPDVVLSYYLLDGLFRVHNGKNLVYLLGNPLEKLQLGVPMMRMYDGDISISSAVQNHWEQYVSKEKRRYLLPSGVELPKESELKNNEFSKQALFIGRLIDRKGLATLLNAFHKVLQTHPTAHLVIAGDGPMHTKLEEQTSELHIRGSVSFTGFVNTNQIQELLNNSSFCVFPSYEGEGLLGVVLESMASAKAVITTTNNGNEDVIRSMENGILVEPRDADGLAANMNFLFSHSEYARLLGRQARLYVQNNLTWEQHAKRLLSIMEEIKK